MNIGIFVTSLRPDSVAQARFQNTTFAGLRELSWLWSIVHILPPC
jgi:hypothetical protein